MSSSLDLLLDACRELPVVTRKMFGGHGVFAPNGGMFAGIVTDDEVILKLVHGPARDELIALGGHPWVYDGQGKAMTMSEWIVVPQNFYDDPELFMTWAARAHALAPPKKGKAGGRRAGASKAKPLAKRGKTATGSAVKSTSKAKRKPRLKVKAASKLKPRKRA